MEDLYQKALEKGFASLEVASSSPELRITPGTVPEGLLVRVSQTTVTLYTKDRLLVSTTSEVSAARTDLLRAASEVLGGQAERQAERQAEGQAERQAERLAEGQTQDDLPLD